MSALPLITYLEKEIFFPVLNATPNKFRTPAEQARFASAQRATIQALRDIYTPDTDAEELLTKSVGSPRVRTLWPQLKACGFATLLDPRILSHCYALI